MYFTQRYFAHRIMRAIYSFLFCLLLSFPSKLISEERVNCKPPWNLERVSSCAINQHPSYQIELVRLNEMLGRKKIAEYYFPNNPNISTYLSNRNQQGSQLGFFPETNHATNFQIMVSQEIFVAGKREKSIQIADEEFQTQVLRLNTISRNIYFLSMASLFRYLNLQNEVYVTSDLYNLSKNLTKLSKARVREGITPGIDESLSESEELRMAKIWKQSVRRMEQAKGELQLLLNVATDEEWQWKPKFQLVISVPQDKENLISIAIQNRPELKVVEKEIKIAVLRSQEVRLQKIPNPSLGAFVQNDGFNERVIGGQISFPLTLWRNYEGETMISKAKEDQSIEFRALTERSVKQDVINAISNYLNSKEEFEMYDEVMLNRSLSDLNHITEALQSGKIKVLDAINNQRILVQTRINYLQTKTEYELAQIELIRALGLPNEKIIITELP